MLVLVSRRYAALVMLVLGSALVIAGCAFDIIPLGPDFGGGGQVDGGDGSGGDGDAPSEVITVTFRNLSATRAVRVEAYLADGELESVPGDLFVEKNRIGPGNAVDGQGIGQANQGIIQPGEQDTLSLSCDRELTIGTTGGTFLDNESGAVLGTGTPNIWTQQGAQFFCGATIVFEYGPDGEGYKTTLLIAN